VQDAYRQTAFLLGTDLAIFERAMNLQAQIVAANAGAARSPQGAALLGFWSRAYSALSDACTLLHLGSYASCPPLLRAACDYIAAQCSLVRDGFDEYVAWFEGAAAQDREHQALAFELGRFRAGSVIAEDERLAPVYRLLTDLAMPHFGATALLTAPETGLQRLALTFGDQAFHLAWAELAAGWLLLLADAQAATAAGAGVFTLDEALQSELAAVSRETAAALANGRRARAEEMDGRFLIHNFRRSPAGAPRRVVLG
jgi:hypothetical protein